MRVSRLSGICVLILAVIMGNGNLRAANKKLPDAEIRLHNGRPTIFIDGNPVFLPGYNVTTEFSKYGSGVHYFWIPGTTSETPFWVGDKISSTPITEKNNIIDQTVESILKGDPDGYILVRYYGRASNIWKKQHPQEYFIN